MHATIPVTVLSGSLGAGKTTLLNHLLRTAGDRDLAVLVNDMGDVNVDADLVAEGSDLDVEGGVAELSNGCICCELQADLETAVVRLAREREFDHLIVESSGISEPAPVARLFTTASRVAARYEIDALVTVLDTRLFLDAFAGQDVPERHGEADDEDVRPLSDLLIEQLEVANVVLLNKTDCCEPDELEEAEALVEALQPDATTIRTEFSAVDPDRLLGLERFDPDRMGELAGWQRALAEVDDHHEGEGHDGHEREDHEDDEHEHGGHENGHEHDGHDEHHHRHPDEVYGVDSFVFRARRPFHPGRFATFLRDLPAGIVRSKGTVWIAGNDGKVDVSQAGPSIRATVRGPWIASLPAVDQDLYRSNRPGLEWHDDHGDRLTELVFIGTEYDESRLRGQLESCLVDDEEWGAASLEDSNQFPVEQGEEAVVREPAD
ncbi:CobW family GTP-binding protein [Natrarchaeobaculum sulfurireducens]|uniref:Metal chaperone, involved in Zn homeostasis n=1 Tax=Natrarchaeobaculum sulfurireducens TaxID=2044521 RepID=A0A346PT89_9EURY|nr:GTP-binding protein [Natrarchaeobaculum sulfurireducens]AXR82734.1 Putative metal chaperone, involved in Zn homeostasis [Natrarchaeobaculum sulfurireducens]